MLRRIPYHRSETSEALLDQAGPRHQTLPGHVVARLVEADGYTWMLVIDPNGRLGWIPDRYLVRLARPPQ